MKKSFIIRNILDLEQLRTLKDVNIVSLSIVENLDFNFQDFKPIVFDDDCSIIINGFDHTLSNLYLCSSEDDLGLFRTNGNIILNNIIFDEFIIEGNDKIGVVVGTCKSLIVKNASLLNCIINGHASVGGFVGECEKLYANNIAIYSDIKGVNYVGALAGMCDDTIIKSTCVDKAIEVLNRDFSLQHMIYTGKTNSLKIDRLSINMGVNFPHIDNEAKKLSYK